VFPHKPKIIVETFIYDITLFKVMLPNQNISRILGAVEIKTIEKRLKGKTLKQTERNYLSRSIRPKLLAAKILTDAKILDRIQRPNKKNYDRMISYNLAKYGYELVQTKENKKQQIISLTELIALILTKRSSIRYIEAIPILLIKNEIDPFELLEVASKYDIKNKIGYLLETADMIAKEKKQFRDLIKYLKRHKTEKILTLGEEKDEEYMEFIEKTTPKRLKKWNLLGRFFDDDFFRLAEVYSC